MATFVLRVMLRGGVLLGFSTSRVTSSSLRLASPFRNPPFLSTALTRKVALCEVARRGETRGELRGDNKRGENSVNIEGGAPCASRFLNPARAGEVSGARKSGASLHPVREGNVCHRGFLSNRRHGTIQFACAPWDLSFPQSCRPVLRAFIAAGPRDTTRGTLGRLDAFLSGRKRHRKTRSLSDSPIKKEY